MSGNVRLVAPVLSRISTHPVELLLSLEMAEAARSLRELLERERALQALRGPLVDAVFALIPGCEPGHRSRLLNLKRRLFSRWDPVDDDAVAWLGGVSAPLAESVRSWNAEARERRALVERARGAYGAELRERCRRLREILGEPLVDEGLRLSSPELHAAARRYAASRDEGKDFRAIENSVVEHLTRACAKPTPRGVLTGLVLGRPADGRRTEAGLTPLPGAGALARRRSLLAWPHARELARLVSSRGSAWRHVVPRANPTWRAVDGKLAFWRRDAAEEVQCRLPSHPLIESFLEACGPRRLKAGELLERVGREHEEYDADELAAQYRRLCEIGLLHGHLEIPFAEIDGLAFAAGWLESVPANDRDDEALGRLRRARAALERVDAGAAPADAAYAEFAAELAPLLPGRDLSPARALVVDSVAPWRSPELPETLCRAAGRAVELLRRLGETTPPRRSIGERMSARLAERFPGRSSVPLLDLYGGESEADFIAPPEADAETAGSGEPVALLAALAAEREKGAGAPLRELRLSREELEAVLPRRLPHASEASGCLLFHVRAPAPGSSDPVQVVCHDVWPSVFSLSRWFHLFGAEEAALTEPLELFARRWAERKAPALLAAALYGYDLQADTAGWHPSYFEGELELAGVRSSLPAGSLPPLRELRLAWDAAAGTARLEWERGSSCRRVFPVIVSSLQTRQDRWLELVRLLGSAGAGRSSYPRALKFTRTPPPAAHLPRVVVDGDIVLLRELWRLRREEFPDIDKSADWELFERVNRWRLERGMPRFVFATWLPKEAKFIERPFLVDFHDHFHLRNLASVLRKAALEDAFVLQEMLPEPDRLWTEKPGARFTHELAAPFRWTAPEKGAA